MYYKKFSNKEMQVIRQAIQEHGQTLAFNLEDYEDAETKKELKAVEKLQERTATANACGVRLFLTQFGCSGYKYDLKLEYNKPTLNDIVYQKILYVHSKNEPFLSQTKMGWVEDKFGEEFTFTNPLETARCGCGESFYIGLNND